MRSSVDFCGRGPAMQPSPWKLAKFDTENAISIDNLLFKVDFLNVNVYQGIKNEEHMNTLLAKEPNWQRIWTDTEFCEKVIHINNHFDLLQQLKPDSMTRMAMFLAVMRPGKANLRNYDWKTIAKTVWDKPADGSYYFKKAHAVAYAHLVALHINLLEEGE